MKKIILALLLAFEIFAVEIAYSQSVTAQISDGLLRMHILANSDSSYDQNIKLEVRDYIISYIEDEKIESKADVKKKLNEMEDKINIYLTEKNVGYSCRILCSISDFDTRIYSGISIPNGSYEALKVILGTGEGKNWWCVAYPPLCFTESAVGELSSDGRKSLEKNLNTDVYNIISGDKAQYKIKFKTVELFNGLMQKFY